MLKIIRGGDVCAPEHLGIMDILISGEQILQISEHIEISGIDIEIIDASGRKVIPGYFDQHVHIIGGGGEDGFASLIPPVQMTDCIRYGVTSVVGLLGTDAHAKSVESLVARTKALREEGMSAWCLTGSYAYPTVTLTGSVGKDIAFIEEVIGVKTAISDHRSSAMDRHELARLATQARTAGLLAGKCGIVHMHTGRGKEGLKNVMAILEETDIPVSQFRPTHCGNQLEDAIAFGKMGGYIDFTASETAAEAMMKAAEEVDWSHITLSSDANGSFPKWSEDKKLIGMGIGKMERLHNCVKDLLKAGLPLEKAIMPLTSNTADALNLGTKKGHLRAGADADMLFLDDYMEITDVISRGRIAMKNGTVAVKNYYDDVQ
ncbi:MAG TPA: beta-aspartyl-peptidase [Erysipelotrichaceae bacterium]|nr:beta-aspartyl-peptidase [Erysipelotrichaceae bacterium]